MPQELLVSIFGIQRVIFRVKWLGPILDISWAVLLHLISSTACVDSRTIVQCRVMPTRASSEGQSHCSSMPATRRVWTSSAAPSRQLQPWTNRRSSRPARQGVSCLCCLWTQQGSLMTRTMHQTAHVQMTRGSSARRLTCSRHLQQQLLCPLWQQPQHQQQLRTTASATSISSC